MNNKNTLSFDSKVSKKTKVIVLYTEAGGGHISVTKAIEKMLTRNGYEVTVLNPYKMVSKCDIFDRVFSMPTEGVYNKVILEKGWKGLFTFFFYLIITANFRLCGSYSAKRFTQRWQEEQPDIIISTIPLSNFAVKKSIKDYKPKTPFIITLTDFHEGSKYSWFPRKDDYYIICPTQKSEKQVLNKPHNPKRVFKTSGIMIDPDFYINNLERVQERRSLNLSPDLVTACIMYGSHADSYVETMAKILTKINLSFQVIFLCGKNKELAEKIKRLRLPYPHLVKSYTQRMPYYLGISDFFIGKSGALAISEALVAKLPLLLDNRQTMIQEKYNLAWVIENQVGSVFKNQQGFIQGFKQLVDPVKRKYFSNNIEKVENRAIFDLPEIMDTIINQSRNLKDFPT